MNVISVFIKDPIDAEVAIFELGQLEETKIKTSSYCIQYNENNKEIVFEKFDVLKAIKDNNPLQIVIAGESNLINFA